MSFTHIGTVVVATLLVAQPTMAQNRSKSSTKNENVERMLPNAAKSEITLAENLYRSAFELSASIKNTNCSRGAISEQHINTKILEFTSLVAKIDGEAKQRANQAIFFANTGQDNLAPLAEKSSKAAKELFNFGFIMRLLQAVTATEARCYDFAADQYVKISEKYTIPIRETDIGRLVRDKLEDLSYRRKAIP